MNPVIQFQPRTEDHVLREEDVRQIPEATIGRWDNNSYSRTNSSLAEGRVFKREKRR